MIKVITPFKSIDDKLIYKFFLEDGIKMSFSAKQKLYYSFLRPFIPVRIRKMIQKKYGGEIRYKENFIYDELVKIIFENGANESVLKQLYPNNYEYAVVLTHDVETGQGLKFIPQVIELEAKYNFKSSWNIVPYKYKIDKNIVNFIRESGNEIGIHGYNHDGRLYYSEKIFTKRAQYINRAIEDYGAEGFRSPMVHRNLEYLQKLNIRYDLSCFDYDPFQPFPGGTGSIWPFIAGKFVEMPYTLPQDHTLFYVLKEKTIDIWRKKIDWLISHRGVILVLTHPDYLAENDHLKKYEELLIYLNSLDKGYSCLPREMAEWWSKKYN
jgi:peptidoglycan/xylan/chitin deacetylase (PgdA/CDA1 family)